MIKNIKFKEKDIQFFQDVCNVDLLMKYQHRIHYEPKSDSWNMLLETTELEEISDLLTIVLIEKGVVHGEVNSLGKVIDDYLGLFSYYDE